MNLKKCKLIQFFCLKQIRKFSTDSTSCGRSMIEMLGVLAIIGVLSVGGIAGYTKAMQMYRSNQQKAALTTLLTSAIELKPNLYSMLTSKNTMITYVFDALGQIPEGMVYKNNYIYDWDGNRIYINYGAQDIGREDGSTYKQYQYLIVIRVALNNNKLSISAQDYCRNIFYAAKAVAQDINNIAFSSKDSSHWSHENWQDLWRRKNFTTDSLVDVVKKCQLVAKEGDTANFYIFIKPN